MKHNNRTTQHSANAAALAALLNTPCIPRIPRTARLAAATALAQRNSASAPRSLRALLLTAAASATALALTATPALAATSTGTWLTGAGDWGTAANWFNDPNYNAVPGNITADNAGGATTIFKYDTASLPAVGPGSNPTINLNVSPLIGFLDAIGYNDVDQNAFRIAGANTLRFNSGSTAPAIVSVNGGMTLTIDAPITTASDLIFRDFSSVLGKIRINGALTTTAHALTFDVVDTYASTYVTGNLIGNQLLTKSGFGRLFLEGTGTTTYTGNVNFDGGTIVVNRANALGTGTIVLSASTAAKFLSLGGTADRTLTNALNLTSDGISLTRELGSTATRLTIAPATSTVSGIGSTVRNINVDSSELYLILAPTQSYSGTGTLTKTGPGTLIMRGANSTFSRLSVVSGTLEANPNGGTTSIGTSAGTGLLGAGGNITVAALATLRLGGTNPASSGTIKIVAGANIALAANAFFETKGAAIVNFEGGTISLNGAYFNVDGPVILGATAASGLNTATTITGTPAGNTLNFSGNITFTANLGITNTQRLNLTNTAAQTLTRDASGTVSIGQHLLKTGTGTTTVGANITAIAFPQGLELRTGTLALGATATSSAGTTATQGYIFAGGGTLSLGRATQLTAGAFFFTSGAGTVALNGFNQTTALPVTITAGASGTFNLGGATNTRTTLALGAVADPGTAILRIANYSDTTLAGSAANADYVTATSVTVPGNVWFRGYNKGAVRDTITGEIYPNAGLLISVYDNSFGGSALAGTPYWNNPQIWVGDDIYNIPDSPGSTATFNNTSTAAATVSLGSDTVTVGKIRFDAAVPALTLGLSGTTGRFIFNSGTTANAEIIVATTNTNTPAILAPIQLNNNLTVNVAASRAISLQGIISQSGTRSVTKTGAGTLFLTNAGSTFSGGFNLQAGTLDFSVSGAADRSAGPFGTGTLTISGTTSSILGHLNVGYTIYNPLAISANTTVNMAALVFRPTTANNVTLTGANTINVNGPRSGQVYSSLDFGPNLNFIGTGSLTLIGANTERGILWQGKNSTFSGGLTTSARIEFGSGAGMSTEARKFIIGRQDASTVDANWTGSGPLTSTSARLQFNGGPGSEFILNGSNTANGTVRLGSGADIYLFGPVKGTLTSGTITYNTSATDYGTFNFMNDLVFGGGTIVGVNVAVAARADIGLNQTISAATAGASISMGRQFNRSGPGTTTIANSINQLYTETGNFYFSGGILKLTRANQLRGQNNATAGRLQLIFQGGSLDLNGYALDPQGSQQIRLYSMTQNTSIMLGTAGHLTFTDMNTGTAQWNTEKTLVVENLNGTWAGITGTTWNGNASTNTYIRFANLPSIWTANSTNITNIIFSGREAGARISAITGGYYYLYPTGASISEWDGNHVAGGNVWGTAVNWLSDVVPSSGNNLGVAFRDLDQTLNGKTISVGTNTTLNRLFLQSWAQAWGTTGAGILTFNGTTPRIEHTNSGSITFASPIAFAAATTFTSAVPGTQGYLELSGTLSGTGSFTQIGTKLSTAVTAPWEGKLRMTGNGTNWTGNFIWQSGHLQVDGTSTRQLGAGTWQIGNAATATSTTANDKVLRLEARSNLTLATNFNLVARDLMLYPQMTDLWTPSVGIADTAWSGHTARTLTLSGNGTIAAGVHRVSAYAAFGWGQTVHANVGKLIFAGTLSGTGGSLWISPREDSTNAFINMNFQGMGTIQFNRTNTFDGGFHFDMWNNEVLVGADNALGSGIVYLYGDAATADIYARLGSDSGTVRSLNNQLDIRGSGHKVFYNISFNRNGSSTLVGTQYMNAFGGAAALLDFGPNHVLTGSGKIDTFFPRSPTQNLGAVGIVRLEGTNTFTGGVDHRYGWLQIGNNAALGTGTLSLFSEGAVGATKIGAYGATRTITNTIALNSQYVFVDNNATNQNLVWGGTGNLTLRGVPNTLQFAVANGDTLTISRPIVNNGGTASGFQLQSSVSGYTSGGILELTNGANAFTGSTYTTNGTLRVVSTTGITTGPGASAGQKQLGLANLHYISSANATLELRAASSADVTLGGSGTIYQIDNGGRLYISQGNARLIGNTTITAANLASPGLLQSAGTIYKSSDANSFSIGVPMTAPLLAISNGNVRPLTNNLFTNLTQITLSGTGTINFDGKNQTIQRLNLNTTTALGLGQANQYIKNLYIGANATIDMPHSSFSYTNPLGLTLDNLIISSGSLHFTNYDTDPDTGLGTARVLANTTAGYLQAGDVINNVTFNNLTTTDRAIVKLANDGKYVLIPFDAEFIWDGYRAEASAIPPQWVADNWTRNSTGTHSSTEYPGQVAGVPGVAVFDNQFVNPVDHAISLTNNEVIDIPNPVHLTALNFKGNNAVNFTLHDGQIVFNSGGRGPATRTRITNESRGNITFDTPILARFDDIAIESYSATIEVQQKGEGNITFLRTISGPLAGVTVTTTGTNRGYVAFKAENLFSREFVLNSGRVLVGDDHALGNGSVVRFRGGSVESVDNIVNSTASQPHLLDNAFQFDVGNALGDGTGIFRVKGHGNFGLTGSGGVSTSTRVIVEESDVTLTLGSFLLPLDAPAGGTRLTFEGAGTVDIKAGKVGQINQVRTIGPLGSNVTTGALAIDIKNTLTKFTSSAIESNIEIFNGATAEFGTPVLGMGTATYAGTVTVDASATLNLTGSGNRLAHGLNVVTATTSVANVKENVTIAAATTNPSIGSTLTGTGTVNITANKTLTLEATASTTGTAGTFSGLITGGGNLAKTGTGTNTQTLSARNAYTGSTTVSQGTLNITGVLGSTSPTAADYIGAISVATGAKLIFAQSAAQTYSGAATGAGSIEKSGSGTFTLTGSISGVQFTAINGGTVATSPKIVLNDGAGATTHGLIQNGSFGANTTLLGNGAVRNAVFSPLAIISPGSGHTYPASIGVLNFGSSITGTTTLTGIIYDVDIAHVGTDDYSDRLAITGNAIFSGTNTINITGAWQDQREMEYTILTTTGAAGVTDGGSAWSNTTFTFNGSTPDPHRMITLESRNSGSDLVLHTIDAYYSLYWNGPVAANNWTSLWESGAPYNWVRAGDLSQTTPPPYAFKNGDVVIFSDIAKVATAGKTLNIAAVGVKPNTLVVDGVGSIFTFNGGPITVQSYQEQADDYFAEYTGISSIPVEVFVQNRAQARFNVALTAPKMNVTGGARAILGDVLTASFTIPEINLGTTSSKGTLQFDRSGANNSTFLGVISGAGDVEKTGATAQVTVSGQHTYTGKTTVTGGTLLVTGSLGGVAREYAGETRLTASGATLTFSGTDASVTQKLQGRLEGAAGSSLQVLAGRKLEISSDWNNTTTVYPAAAGTHNNFRGNVVVSGPGSYLTVSGRLDVQEEAFDQNLSPYVARTYTHSNYYGDMRVSHGGTLEFTYNRDWQVVTGALTGDGSANAGTFKVNTGQHFYFMGNASAYAGNTVVTGGSAFHLPTGAGVSGQYGTAGVGAAGTFEVSTGSSLHIGSAGRLNAATLQMDAGSTLSVVPGGYTVNIASVSVNAAVAAGTVKLADNINIIIAAGNGLTIGTYGGHGIADITSPPAAAGVSSVSFANAGGNVFTGANVGVLLPATVKLNVGIWGYLPKVGDLKEWVLMDGLDTVAIVGGRSPEVAIDDIFGHNGELTIMGAKFQLSFSMNKLVLTQGSLRRRSRSRARML